MADHPRKAVRAAIVQLLRTQGDDGSYPTMAGARVYDSADSPGDTDEPTEINVYMVDETIDPAFRHDGGMRRRIMGLRIECYYNGALGGERADRMAWEVENAIRTDPTVGNLVEWCHLENTQIVFAERGDISLFCAVMAWQVIYYTHEYQDGVGRPVTVMLGFDPDIGPGNESDYTAVIEGIL